MRVRHIKRGRKTETQLGNTKFIKSSNKNQTINLCENDKEITNGIYNVTQLVTQFVT